MALQKVGIERMIFEAALFLVLVLAMTVPIVKALRMASGLSVRSVHQSTQMKPGRAD
jgi:hypothetical protein